MANKKDNTSAEDVSIFSRGVKIEGKVYSEGNVRIDGKVLGEIIINGNLTLGEKSEINGDIKAKNLTISGSVEGSVQTSEKLILEKNASLRGDIITKILVVEEGSTFDGRSSMSQNSSMTSASSVA